MSCMLIRSRGVTSLPPAINAQRLSEDVKTDHTKSHSNLDADRNLSVNRPISAMHAHDNDAVLKYHRARLGRMM